MGGPSRLPVRGYGDTEMWIWVDVLTPLVCLSVLLPPSVFSAPPPSYPSLFPGKELIKPKAILGRPVERPTDSAAADAAGAAGAAGAFGAVGAVGAVGAADECPGPGARGVAVKNHRCQVCRPPSQFLKSGTSYSLWRPRDL